MRLCNLELALTASPQLIMTGNKLSAGQLLFYRLRFSRRSYMYMLNSIIKLRLDFTPNRLTDLMLLVQFHEVRVKVTLCFQ